MGRRRVATLVIVAGGVGLLVASVLRAKFPASDGFDPAGAIPPVWTRDGDLHLSVALTLLLLGLAGWHLRRFGIGKLVVIGVLAAVALWSALFDFGTGEAVWSADGHVGDELVGIWLFIGSAAVVLAGVVWSSFGERPPGTKTLWSYVFGGGPGGSTVTPGVDGEAIDDGRSPPEGWWLASDGRWYPPELHADATRSSPGSGSPTTVLWRWGRWVLVAVVAYVMLALGQFLFVGDEARPGVEDDDRGPVQDEEWWIAIDEPATGIHTIHMIKTFRPLDLADVDDVGGRLIWTETEAELCRVGIRSVGDGFVQVGDIFSTDEICGNDHEVQRAVDDHGVPNTACVHVRSHGVDDEYCAPLSSD